MISLVYFGVVITCISAIKPQQVNMWKRKNRYDHSHWPLPLVTVLVWWTPS